MHDVDVAPTTQRVIGSRLRAATWMVNGSGMGGSGGGSLEHWRQWLGGHPGTRPPRGECQAAWSCWVRPGEVQELSSGSAKGGYFDHAAPPSCRSRSSRAKRSERCQR